MMSGAYEISSSRHICKEMSLWIGPLPFVIHQNGKQKLSLCKLIIHSHKVCTNLHVHTHTHMLFHEVRIINSNWGWFVSRALCSFSLSPTMLRPSYSCIMLLSPENLHFASFDFFSFNADCLLSACSYCTVFHFQHDRIRVISIYVIQI